jgi:transposase
LSSPWSHRPNTAAAKRTIDVREILNGIFYVLWTGCQWRALPKDLPPKSTVWAYFDLWTWNGTLERIHHALYAAVREQAGREASPTTAIIDSQSVKGAQKGGLARPAGGGDQSIKSAVAGKSVCFICIRSPCETYNPARQHDGTAASATDVCKITFVLPQA